MNLEKIAQNFRQRADGADWTLRLVNQGHQGLRVRQDVLQPVSNVRSAGAMITLAEDGGIGYGATSDLSAAGLGQALEQARGWARASAGLSLISPAELPRLASKARYATPVKQDWESIPLSDKVDLLRQTSERLHIDPRIVDWHANLDHRQAEVLLASPDGAHIHQSFSFINPGLAATANQGSNTQSRSHGGGELACQGGWEQLARVGFDNQAQRVATESLELLGAPDCPTGEMDLLLMPRQMILQIHESIGHPLELDRILGDERNYAGTSFVSLDMFGAYQYGSALLNVTFDPGRPEQLASYAYDDEGTPAERSYVIEQGILQRPLGGATSQARAGMSGVASARASDWNRPPIDRMANLNLEPGESTLDEMISGIEYGVLMDTNRSWSIDDSRNKFQFGCEYGREIRNGELGQVLKNPNYRGISATFWRNLNMVGDSQTYEVGGTPFCGKGEPNQAIHVGHSAPACVFAQVDVFGGA